MELRQLAAFEAIITHGSFTRAAEVLFVTQPAITRQIAQLEAELRTRLFERLGRTVHLTEAGIALHRYAETIVRLTNEAESVLADVVTGTTGRLAVGASSTTATYILPGLLRRFRESHPAIELSVHTGVSAQVTAMVLANEVDVGVVTAFREQPGLVEIALTEYATGVVVYPDHPLAQKGREGQTSGVSAEELAGCPLILMEEGTNLRTYVDRLLSTAGVEERVTMELDNVEAIKKMIEARLGISLLPLIAVEAEVKAGRLVARSLADVPGATRRIAAIHRQDKYLSATLKAFLKLLKSGQN